MCLESTRGVARALESKLKERMLIKHRAELGWAKADDKNSSLISWLIELPVETGQRVLRVELDPRHVRSKKNVKPLSSLVAHDHEFTCQDEFPEDERIKLQNSD